MIRFMWFKVCLLALLVIGTVWADDKADYERSKIDVQERMRELNRAHGLKSYEQAMKLQGEVAAMSRKALEFALKSPDIQDSGAWRFHSDTLRDSGFTEEALVALDAYFKTPLLDRNGKREGWKRRSQIYKRAGDMAQAQAALERALRLADKPNDEFNLRRDLANHFLKEQKPDAAFEQTTQMTSILSKLEADRHLSAQRDLQSVLQRVYEELGNAAAARQAKYEVLKLRLKLLQEEVDGFDARYPED
jgi:tetratricopeptide (TPR) repeat protein